MRIKRFSAGDTIIEVMLAFTVFSVLAVGAISIMNQGVASAQDALETTLVRQQIDGQAETLRFLHQAYMSDPTQATAPGTAAQKFRSVMNNANENVNPTRFGDPACITTIPQNSAVGSRPSFIVDPRTGMKREAGDLKTMSSMAAPAYAQLKYDISNNLETPYGIWIEAIKGGESGEPVFIDFHIRACWSGVTSDVPRTLGTIVRLYVPA